METGDYILHPKNIWNVIRSAISAAESALGATSSKWSSLLANYDNAWFTQPENCNKLKIRFRFTDPAANAEYSLYSIKKDEDAFAVCDGIAYAGTQVATQEISGETTYHCDRITVANEYWGLPVKSSCEDSTAENKRAMLLLSSLGDEYFLAVITSISAGSVAIDFMGYED